MQTAEEDYDDDRAPGLLRHHHTECPAYNTKGRDVASEPCVCGARNPDHTKREELDGITATLSKIRARAEQLLKGEDGPEPKCAWAFFTAFCEAEAANNTGVILGSEP